MIQHRERNHAGDGGVVVDPASAALLVAEGAMCFDTDNGTTTCEGQTVLLPVRDCSPLRPVLVCGSSADVNSIVADFLEEEGLPAWQVTQPLPGTPDQLSGVVRPGSEERDEN